MSLSYTQLLRFDLLADIEKNLGSGPENVQKLIQFLNICQEINIADQFIKDLPSFPRSTTNIIRNELVSAIGSTLAIEGITVKEDEIKEVLQEPELKKNVHRQQQEILNSQKVYEYVKAEVDRSEGVFIYTIDHLCTIHKLFTDQIEYFGNVPGRFRNEGATFGEPRKKSLCGNYTDIYEATKYFIEWLNEKGKGPWSSNIFAKAMMAHYYLTEIHPFGDGNGRMARAIEAMVLYANLKNRYCFWSLANFWSTNRSQYIAQLGNIRHTCDPADFILWGSQGYLQEVKRIKTLVLKKVKQLMYRDYVNWLLNTNEDRPVKERINKRIFNVLMLLARVGKVPLDKFRSDPSYKAYYTHYSAPTSGRDITKMKNLELIRLTSPDDKEYIEPNYEIFDNLEYKV